MSEAFIDEVKRITNENTCEGRLYMWIEQYLKDLILEAAKSGINKTKIYTNSIATQIECNSSHLYLGDSASPLNISTMIHSFLNKHKFNYYASVEETIENTSYSIIKDLVFTVTW
jgi:hypothetical protein